MRSETVIKAFAIVATLSISFPSACSAQEAGGTGDDDIFELVDMDRNRQIDRPEFVTQKMLVFSVLDSNRDLALAPAELPAFSTAAFTRMDADGNGSLSELEFNQAAREEMFVFLDRNDDGVITPDEMSEFRKGK